MKSYRLIVLAVAVLLSTTMKAQFHHAIGASYLSAKGKVPSNATPGTERPKFVGYGLHYYTRYDVKSTENSTISVGLPISTGVGGHIDPEDGGSIGVLADVAVTADYNVGAGSSEDNEAGFGGFIGVGFGYTYSNYIDTEYEPGLGAYYDKIKGNSYGPLLHGGVRAKIGNLLFFFRGFYKVGLESAKFKSFGISAGISL